MLEKGGDALLLFAGPIQVSFQEWCGYIADHSGWVCVDVEGVCSALEVVAWALWAFVVVWVGGRMVWDQFWLRSLAWGWT